MRSIGRAGSAFAASVFAMACLAAGGITVANHGEASPRSSPESAVLGYVESGDGSAAMRPNLSGLTSVGVDGLNIDQDGTGVSRPDASARAMLTVAHRAGKTAQLLVGNYSSKINDFDPAIAHRLFASAKNRTAVIAALVADARRGWDTIQLDLESLHGSDMVGLSRFTAQLRAALPSSKTLAMAVMANATLQGYRDDAYDLPTLAKHVNQVVLMAYDQHGPTWTGAGPVGGLPWAEQALKTMLKVVPHVKAVLGVAGYGYTWPKQGTGNQLSDAAARHAAVNPIWDARNAEWHSELRGGGTIWWSDAKSLHVRQSIARSLHLGGIAVWSLGLSDRLTPAPR